MRRDRRSTTRDEVCTSAQESAQFTRQRRSTWIAILRARYRAAARRAAKAGEWRESVLCPAGRWQADYACLS